MKNANLDLLFVLLLVLAAARTQFHVSDLPVLGALGLVPLLGSIVATPRKSTKRPTRVYADNSTE